MPIQALDNSWLLRLATNGNAGVDIFLVLTGLFATTHLVPALQQACKADLPSDGIWSIVRRYYRKRAINILPPYATALLLVLMISVHSSGNVERQLMKMPVMQFCPSHIPLNLLLLNNFAGFAGCGTVSTSLVSFWQFVWLQIYLSHSTYT